MTVGSFDLTPIPALPMDDFIKRRLGVLPAGLEKNDWIFRIQFIKIQWNNGRYVIAHAPNIAREISKTDHIVGLTSVQVGSYECKDKPRSCRIRYSEITVTLLAELTCQ